MPRSDRDLLELFATATGDRNPLHLNRSYAATAGYDANVVFGTLLVLQALDLVAEAAPGPVRRVRADFRAPVLEGQAYDLDVHRRATGMFQVDVRNRSGRVAAAVTVERATDDVARPVRSLDTVFPSDDKAAFSALGDWRAGAEFAVACEGDHAALKRLAPRSDSVAGTDTLALLGTVTRVVGMVCPGEAAILRSFDVQFDENGLASPQGRVTVTRVDHRFDVTHLTIAFDGAVAQVTAGFRRPAPAVLRWDDALELVEPGEFVGVRAIAVGASRGLGHAASRLLLAGGAHVLATSRRDAVDAVDVGAAGNRLDTASFDVTRSIPASLVEYEAHLLLWFATPPITASASPRWQADDYDAYRAVYAEAMEACAVALAPLRGLLVPSSTYVDKHPPGLAEYAAAKALGERVADFLVERAMVRRTERPRLPPVLTQQNNTSRGLAATGLQDIRAAAEMLLPPLRRLANG